MIFKKYYSLRNSLKMAARLESLELSSPSRLTSSQKDLITYLHETTVTTRVRERVEDGSLEPKIITVEDRIKALAFVGADDRHRRFAGVEHLSLPRNPLQPVYLSFRGLDLAGIKKTAEVMAEIKLTRPDNKPNLKPEVVTGVPSTGSAIMKEYAKITGIPYVDVLAKNSEDKIVGADNQQPGSWQRLLLGDDLISTGLSKFPSINEVQNSRYRLEAVLVLIDRRRFDPGEFPCPLFFAFHLVEAAHYLATQDMIPASTFYEVRNYFSRHSRIAENI